MGSKNHEVVPTTLAAQLSGLRTGAHGAQNSIRTLAKAGLISRVRNVKYDGYRLSYSGYDYLALHSHTKSSAILHLGSEMGAGKESDIRLVTSPSPTHPLSLPTDPDDPTASNTLQSPTSTNNTTTTTTPAPTSPDITQAILKIHRLGRTSFRAVTRNRAYAGRRTGCSWQYLSRLSAQKEYTAMKVLHEAGFRVPRPIAWNRHTVVMGLVPGVVLKDVGVEAFGVRRGIAEGGLRGGQEGVSYGTEKKVESPDMERQGEGEKEDEESKESKIAQLYSECIELALSLASRGCLHGDLNEFNILIENVPDTTIDDASSSEPQTQDNATHTTDPISTPQTTRTTTTRPLIPHLIDFPQITSLSHPNASSLFARDIAGIKNHFRRRYNFESEDEGPTFEDALERLRRTEEQEGAERLDIKIEAAGFIKKPRHGGGRVAKKRGQDANGGEATAAVEATVLEEYYLGGYHGGRDEEGKGEDEDIPNEADVGDGMQPLEEEEARTKDDKTDALNIPIASLAISTNPQGTTTPQPQAQQSHQLPSRSRKTKSKKAAAGWSI
ncbi:MAG: Serine/threonine-protein kinase RIO2 [Alyxoria varia]|nr:MAG: Serine/threonine-protein kinase RIO2 [Alyxoria varia]